jgi:hypothetical protein
MDVTNILEKLRSAQALRRDLSMKNLVSVLAKLLKTRPKAGVFRAHKLLHGDRRQCIQAADDSFKVDSRVGREGLSKSSRIFPAERGRLIDEIREQFSDLPFALDER